MTSKQRSNLKAIAANLKPVAQVGKEGIGENLVRVTLLPASGEDGKGLAAELAALLKAETVAVIGRKAIFYRRSKRKDFEHIEF